MSEYSGLSDENFECLAETSMMMLALLKLRMKALEACLTAEQKVIFYQNLDEIRDNFLKQNAQSMTENKMKIVDSVLR